MRVDPYQTLGVPKDADPTTVKRAYRRAAKRAHPDRNGGDTKAMVAVNVAYDILSDPRRRERFDLGAEDEPTITPLDARARAKLSQVFLQFAAAPQRLNIVSNAKSALHELKRQQLGKLSEMDATAKRLKARLPDVTCEGEGPNVFLDTLTSYIANLTEQQAQAREDVQAIERALELLVAYKSSVIDRPQPTPYGFHIFASTSA